MSLGSDALDIALAGAKGAAAGSVVPGIGTAVGGALGVAQALLPGVAHWLGADDATTAKVTQAVQAVTGQTDPAAQEAAIGANPQVEATLRQQLAQIAADREAAAFADVQDARQQTEALAKDGSPIAWGAPVVSAIVLVTFGVLSGLLLFRAVPDASTGPLQILLGNLGTMAAGVVAYWVGSSAGSEHKTRLLAQSVPASMIPRPAAVVPASDVKGH